MQIVELTGLSWPAVRTAVDFYEAGGMAAPKPKPRGKRSGEGRILTPGTISTGLEAFVDFKLESEDLATYYCQPRNLQC